MKQISTLIIATLITLTSFAGNRPVIKLTTWYGNWTSASSWNLNRIPQDGDSIVITAGHAVLTDKEIKLNDVVILVESTNSSAAYLHLKKPMVLDENSSIILDTRAYIMVFGANRKKEIITIGGVAKFNENSNANEYGFGVANKNSGTAPLGFSLAAALPVQFTSFTATRNLSNVTLAWTTADEKDNSHFEIEKSTDGSNWKTAAVVMGNGTTSKTSNYSYTDKNENSAVVYYRIRQIDLNGSAAYTTVKMIRNNENTAAKIYKSAANTVTIELNSTNLSNLKVAVLNLNGQVMSQQTFAQATAKITMQVNTTSAGVYLVQLTDKSGRKEVKKLVF